MQAEQGPSNRLPIPATMCPTPSLGHSQVPGPCSGGKGHIRGHQGTVPAAGPGRGPQGRDRTACCTFPYSIRDEAIAGCGRRRVVQPAHHSLHAELPPAPHGVLAALLHHISTSLPAPSPPTAPPHGQRSWGCARSLRHLSLALLRPEQSLEGAPSPGAVWSHPCVLGWAGTPLPWPSDCSIPWGCFSCTPCLEQRAQSSWDKLQWVPCALGSWTSPGLGARGQHPASFLCQAGGTETSASVMTSRPSKLVLRLVCLTAPVGANIPNLQNRVPLPHLYALWHSLGSPPLPGAG